MIKSVALSKSRLTNLAMVAAVSHMDGGSGGCVVVVVAMCQHCGLHREFGAAMSLSSVLSGAGTWQVRLAESALHIQQALCSDCTPIAFVCALFVGWLHSATLLRAQQWCCRDAISKFFN